MTNPITWRNVNAPSNSDAIALLDLANQSVNRGFDGLTNSLRQVQTNRQNEYQRGSEVNTQNILNTLSQFRTPEEFTQARDSGFFDRLISETNGQLDNNTVRTALDGRLAQLQNTALNNTRFENQQRTAEEAPVLDSILTQALNGDIAGATNRATNADLANNANVLQQIQGIRDTQQDRQVTVDARLRQQASLDAQRQFDASLTGLQNASTEDYNAAVSGVLSNPNLTPQQRQANLMTLNQINNPQLSPADNERFATQLAARVQTYSTPIDQNIFNPTNQQFGTQDAADVVTRNADKFAELTDRQRTNTIRQITEYITSGKEISVDTGNGTQRIRVTPALIDLALANTTGGYFEIAEDFESNIEDILGSINLSDQFAEYQDYRQFTSAQNNFIRNLRRGNTQPQTQNTPAPLVNLPEPEEVNLPSEAELDALVREALAPETRTSRSGRSTLRVPIEEELRPRGNPRTVRSGRSTLTVR